MNFPSVFLEIIKIIASMLTAALSAYLGFRAACRRDDRATKQAAAVKLALLQEQLARIDDHQEVIDLHRVSVPDLCADVIRAMHVLPNRAKQQAQQLWDTYSNLNPSQFCTDEIFSQIRTWQAQNTFLQFSKESLFTAKDVMARLIQALRQVFS